MRNSLFATATLAVSAVYAGSPRSWEHSTQSDFEKGTIQNLSLRSDGRLSLAPEFRELYDPSIAYFWAVAEDSRGAIYAAGSGQDGAVKLFMIDPSGKGRVLAELPGLSIHAIAIDRQDRVYAATSPDGKVYRVAANGSSEVFYDPQAKYIWALVFSKQGDLFVATGEKGEVHRVTPAGKGAVFFRAEEAQARSLAVGADGTLFVGTQPDGLILKVSPAGEGFVLYQTPKDEITALALDSKGALYAAAVGNKQPLSAPAPPAPAAAAAAPPAPPGAAAPRPAPVPSAIPPARPGATVAGGSEVYRIEPDGYPRKVWTSASEIAYSLAFDPSGRLLIGTGNKGEIYRLDSDLLYSLLLSASPTQVTAMANGRGGRVLAATGNIAKIYQLGPGTEKQGSYESQALDAGYFAYWGRINFSGEGAAAKLETRSGNVDTPQRNWSPWALVVLNSSFGRVASPPARFLQYRLSLSAGNGPAEVSGVDIAYLPKNVAPVVELIDLTPPNYQFQKPALSLSSAASQTITLAPLNRNAKAPITPASSDTPAGTMNYTKGWVGARWLARDDNGDALLCKVEIRGRAESSWKLLREPSRDRQISWDSTAFPDGEYVLRLTASDAPGNPPDQALEGTLESDVFVIDNTPPRITGLTATRNGSQLELRWRAADVLNTLSKAEYSLDGGEWKAVEPTTRITDSAEHDYVLRLDNITAGEHTVAVRVADAYDNPAVDKALIR